MSSPFATLEEFNNAIDGPTGGAIYTFAGAPIINVLALLAAVGIFVWFMIATYTTHAEPPAINKSIDRLSSFIVIGLLSLVAADFKPSAQAGQESQAPQATHRTTLIQLSRKAAPFGLLGMIGVGLPLGRSKGLFKGQSKAQRKKRSEDRVRNSLR
ncbi:MAG: hypothetical protein AAFO06_06705 [Cyanobacteria bacterium J06597_16]